MSEAILETDVRQNALGSAKEEEARIKFSELQEGLRTLFRKRDIPLGPGVSGSALLSVLSQTMGVKTAEYAERLRADWHEEYERFIGQIALLTAHSEINTETKPSAILDSIESHLAHAGEQKI